MAEQGVPYREEIPLKEIQEALTNGHHEVLLRLRRRMPGGQYASVGSMLRKPTADLAVVEDWLRALAGGGNYYIDPMDPSDPTAFVVPKFRLQIEGNPKPIEQIRRAQTEPEAVGPRQRSNGNGYDDDDSMPVERERHRDAVAERQLARERTRNEDLLHELREEREKHAAEMRALNDRLGGMEKSYQEMLRRQEREMQDERLRREREASEQRIAALEQRLLNTPKPTFDASMAAAFVPVLVALVESGKAKQELAVAGQQRSMELQFQTLTTMLGSKKDGPGADVLATLMPIIQSALDEKSPSKMAEMVASFAEANLTSLSMLAELAKQNMPDDNPWADALRSGIDTIVESMQSVVKSRQMGPGAAGGTPRQLQPGQGQPRVQQPQQPMDAQQIADAIYQAPELPTDLKTREWYQIFYYLHAKEAPPKIAKRIADHLGKLRDHGELPQLFAYLFDSNAPPSQHLAQLVSNLPIAQVDPAYAQSVLQAFDQCFVLNDAGPKQSKSPKPPEPPTQRAPSPPEPEELDDDEEDEAEDDEDEDDGDEDDGEEDDGEEADESEEAAAEVVDRKGQVFRVPGRNRPA